MSSDNLDIEGLIKEKEKELLDLTFECVKRGNDAEIGIREKYDLKINDLRDQMVKAPDKETIDSIYNKIKSLEKQKIREIKKRRKEIDKEMKAQINTLNHELKDLYKKSSIRR